MPLFEKSFPDLSWYAMEGEDKDQRGIKILLISMVEVKKPKEARMEDLDGLNIKWKLNEGLTASSRGHPTSCDNLLFQERQKNNNLLSTLVWELVSKVGLDWEET